MMHDIEIRRRSAVSRRRFLQASAAFGGGLLIGWVEVADAAETSAVDAPATSSRPTPSSASTARAR